MASLKAARRRLIAAAILGAVAAVLAWDAKPRAARGVLAPSETRGSALAATASDRATILPLAVSSSVPPVSAAKRSAVSDAIDRIGGIGAKSRLNASELADAYEQVARFVHEDEAASLAALKAELAQLPSVGSLKQNFFLVNAYSRALTHPEAVLQSVREAQGELEPDVQVDAHHEMLTPTVVLRRLEAYTVKQLRARLNGGYALDPGARSQLIAEAVAKVQTEKSLDVTLEYVELLKQLGEGDRIPGAVSARSPRDQKLIGEYLAAS